MSRAVTLAQRPVGMPKPSDFAIIEMDLPQPGPNEIQVENVCMSVDPYMRGRMVDRKSYVPPFQIGEVLTGGSIGQVTASNHPDFSVGDYVSSHYGWREAYTAPAEGIEKLGELVAPPSAYLGAIGMPGMTAYVGLLELAHSKTARRFLSPALPAPWAALSDRLPNSRVAGYSAAPDPRKKSHG